MKKAGLLLLAVVVVAGAVGLGATSAQAAVGMTLKVGTQGVGADMTIGIHEKVNARVNLNSFSYGKTINADEDDDGSGGGTISPQLKLLTIGALLDWHPWAGGFRLSAGCYLNKNKLDLTADLSDTVEINDRDYTLSNLGGTVDFNSLAPYVGLGYGNAAGSNGHWHFSFDIGVMFQGAPQVDLRATVNDPTIQSQLDADIAEEEKTLEDDLGVFTIYPVISLGVSYRF